MSPDAEIQESERESERETERETERMTAKAGVVCVCVLTVLFLILGIVLLCSGCNETLYPLGCPMFTTVVGTVLATTVALTSCGSGTQTCYTVYINWSVCTEKVRGFDRDWMSSMLNTYSPGHQETLWLSKHGVKNECFSNPTKNHADVAELIPGFGIIFLILSGILLVCTVLCITAHCTRKRTVSPPLVPPFRPVSV